jgi:hypothetical protein
MRTRTPQEFDDFVDAELAWRRKEMIDFRLMVRTASGSTCRALCRAGVAMAYAHWEGFTKAGCQAYLDYVAKRKLTLREMAPPFAALAIERQAESNASQHQRALVRVQMLRDNAGERFPLPRDHIVETRSNLSSEVLANIFQALGLETSLLEQKFNLLDRNLLPARNSIAHGRETAPTPEDFEQVHDQVSDMLGIVGNQLRNAVLLQAYRA